MEQFSDKNHQSRKEIKNIKKYKKDIDKRGARGYNDIRNKENIFHK